MQKIINTLRILLGIGLVAMAVVTIPQGPFMVLFGTALAVMGALCLYPFLIAPFAAWTASIFFPASAGRFKEQFCQVRGMIARQDFTEAEHELRELLKKQPGLIDASVLLATMLYENRGRANEALAIARDVVARDKWLPEHESLVSLAVDILLDRGEKQEAAALLRQQSEKAGHTGAASRMTERLRYLSQ